MKFFVLSDIHGFYTELKQALDESGYDPRNPGHLLIHCGDCFDRGGEALRVLDYLESLPRKVLLRGNHEDMLEDALTDRRINYIHERNGTDLTIEQLFGDGCIDAYGHLTLDPAMKRRLLTFMSGMADYYETSHYVFTHGWVPLSIPEYDPRHPIPDPDWRSAGPDTWRSARWLEWQQVVGAGISLPDKTVVCGHRPARMGCMFDPTRDRDDPSPFFGRGTIAIDACTVRSHRVNVLVLEDE